MTQDNIIKIGDLGVSKIHQVSKGNLLFEKQISPSNRFQSDQSTQISKMGRVGTPLYLSPEVVR